MEYAQPRMCPGEWDPSIIKEFWVQTDHLVSARRLDLKIAKKKKWSRRIVRFVIPADHRVKFKAKREKNTLTFLERTKKNIWNTKVRVIPLVFGILGIIPEGIGKLGNKRTSGDYSENSIVKIDQNTEKSPGDFNRLAVTHTLVDDHQLTLLWKTLKGFKQLQ